MKRTGEQGASWPRQHRLALATACAFVAAPALAIELDFGEVKGAWNTTVTVGTAIRTKDADPCCYGAASGNAIGVPGGTTGGPSGNLNFEKGEPFSTVVKAVSDLELKYRNFGGLVRGVAWYDYTLKNSDVRIGNQINLYTRPAPLGEDGLSRLASFSGVDLLDAFVYGNFDIGQTSLAARLGQQVVSWGEALLIPGGINNINPIDVSALRRPGSQIKEALLPVGMLYGNLGVSKELSFEAFYQYAWRQTELEACGTFFGNPDYIPKGCNGTNVLGGLGITEFDVFNPASTKVFPGTNIRTLGAYVHRAGDNEAKDSGQYGLALRYLVDAIETEFGLYYTNTHAKTPSLEVVLPTSNAILQAPGLAGQIGRLKSPEGLYYRAAFPEDIKVFGLSFATNIAGASVFGEVGHRRDQPLTLNASDLIAAFLTRSPNSALNITRGVNNLPAGSIFKGYDLFNVTTGDIGMAKNFPHILGASTVNLLAEVGVSTVANLPDPAFTRYGRSDAYGVAQVGTLPCTEGLAGKTCARDGFVTGTAWGYRLRAAAQYQGVLYGANLTPSIVWGQDVSGYSYDGTFQEGRKTLAFGLRTDYLNKYFAELTYVTYLLGGNYNLLADRDYVAISAGMSF